MPGSAERTPGKRLALRPFDWRVGCGAFGRLQHSHAGELLIETVRFDEREAVLVDLADGSRRVLTYTQAHHAFAPLSPSKAAAAAGMPEPVTLKVGDMARRIDPFHSERYLSARFRSLCALIFARSLPCAYGLLKASGGEWDGRYEGAHIEDPEQTAANVSETLARNPTWTLAQALRDQLARDAQLTGPALAALFEATGWASVFGDLAGQLDEHQHAAPYPLLGELDARQSRPASRS